MEAGHGVSLERIDERQKELQKDVSELRVEMNRTRGRLHNLEGFAQAYLDAQQANRNSEDKQYRKMANRIGLVGLMLTAALVTLAIVTVIYHK